MTNKKQHISEKEFQRYLENKMTDAERNAFERALQKHPFEADALEGMQEISPEELKTDLHELKLKIKTGKRKNKTRLWAAAATLLLLVSTGILWFQLKDKSPIPELTDNKTIQKQEEKVAPSSKDTGAQKQAKKIAVVPPKTEVEKSVQVELNKGKEPVAVARSNSLKTESQTEKKSINQEITPQLLNEESETISAAAQPKSNVVIRGATHIKSASKTPNVAFPQATLSPDSSEKIIRGKIISLADSLPLAGATVVEKGTGKGIVTDNNGNFTLQLTGKNDSILTAQFVGMNPKNFQPSQDTFNIIGLKPNQLALDEVVVSGYDSSNKKKTLTGYVTRAKKMKDSDVQPVGGMDAYKNYLDKNAVLPNNYKRNREVVKLLIDFDKTGEITHIENKNQADITIFEKAKKIIKNGPEWNPEIRDGKPVESQSELRIVFRKTD